MLDTIKDATLFSYYELARDAHRNISFDPERRGALIIKECSEELDSDLEKLDAEHHEDYKARYISKMVAWLNAKSRCASSMITGPANFNTARNAKANQSEHNRLQEFTDFRDNYFARLEKAKERAKTPDEKRADFVAQCRKEILSSAETIHSIDAGLARGTSRPLIVANLFGKIQTMVRRGDSKVNAEVLALLKELDARDGLIKPIFTQRHKVWALLAPPQVSEDATSEDQANREFSFEGGKVIINFEVGRLQIVHDAVPAYEVRQELKSNGFKWSPLNKAWQRNINAGSVHAARRVTGLEIDIK